MKQFHFLMTYFGPIFALVFYTLIVLDFPSFGPKCEVISISILYGTLMMSLALSLHALRKTEGSSVFHKIASTITVIVIAYTIYHYFGTFNGPHRGFALMGVMYVGIPVALFVIAVQGVLYAATLPYKSKRMRKPRQVTAPNRSKDAVNTKCDSKLDM